jgi:hypothetical protein
MVCDTCEKKLTKVCVPDKWKDGARNTIASSGGKITGKTNKIIQSLSKSSYIPENSLCRICKSKVMQSHYYCNDCAHKKGICTMCGKKTVDVTSHKMSLK